MIRPERDEQSDTHAAAAAPSGGVMRDGPKACIAESDSLENWTAVAVSLVQRAQNQ